MRKAARWAALCLVLAGLARGGEAASPGTKPASGAEDRAARLAALRREAASLHPPSPTALSDRLTKIGIELLDASETDEAVEVLAEAVGQDPENGAALSALILGYLERDELSFADYYLEQAVESTDRRGSSAKAYAEIGDRYAAGHRLAQAITAWDYARRLGGADPRMLAALERTRRELSVERPQRALRSEHFSLYTDDAIPEELASRAEAHLEEEQRRFEKFFALPPGHTSRVVVLYAGRDYFSLVSVPTWVSGIFDGKIRVSLETPPRWSPQLAAILSHELSHAFLREASHGNAPSWLHEGLAQWLEGRRVERKGFRGALQGGPVLSLAQMESGLLAGASRSAAQSVYVEALGIVEYLVQERGPAVLSCLIADLARGDSIDQALQEEAGMSAADLLARWKKWAA